jgi:hypothetical protein
MHRNLTSFSQTFKLKLGLFTVAHFDGSCIRINPNNYYDFKNLSPLDFKDLLRNTDYLKIDDLVADEHFIRTLECSGEIYKGNTSNQVNYFINLDDGYEKYIDDMKSKYKKELRREVRRFYEAFESVEVTYFDKSKEMTTFLDDMLKVHTESWKKGILAEIKDTEITKLINEGQWLGVIVYANGIPISFMHGKLNQTTGEYLLISNGYVESAKNLKPGKIIISKIIEQHSQFNINRIDFGSGDSVYKKIFCNDVNNIYTVKVSRKWSKFYFIFLMQSSLDAFYKQIKSLSQYLNFEHKLRAIVRSFK